MGGPLAALAVLAAVSGGFAPAAFEGAGVWTGRVGTGFGHAWIQGCFRMKDVVVVIWGRVFQKL